LEGLEARTVPSATLTIDASNNLTFTGGGGVPNQLTLTRLGQNYTFSDTAEIIDIVDLSPTVQFTGSGTHSVTQIAGTVFSIAINGGFIPGSSATIGAGGISGTGGVSVTGWDSIAVNGAVTVGGVGHPVQMSATAGSNRSLSIASGATISTAGGPVNLGGSKITNLGADISSGGGHIAVNFAVNLTNDVTVNAGPTGNVSFWGLVNGAHDLIINTGGTTTFGDVVGGTTPLSSLATNAGGSTVAPGGAITTTGAQLYEDAVILPPSPQLTASTATFASTLTGGGGSLTISGSAVFGGTFAAFSNVSVTENAVFNGKPSGVGSLAISGTATINVDNVTTSGTQTYDGGIVLGTDSVLTGTVISLAGTIAGGDQDLSIGGDTVLSATSSLLSSFSVTGSTVFNVGAVSTSGPQTYSSAVTLGTDVNLTAAAISLNSVAGNSWNLTISGAASLAGNIDGLSSLTIVGSSTLSGGTINTAGSQTFDGPTSLGSHTHLTASSVLFDGPVTGNSKNLTITGNAIIAATLGSLNSLSISGSSSINTSQISANTQTYSGPITIGTHATLSGVSGNINSTVAGGNFDLTLGFSNTVSLGAVTGVRHLTVPTGAVLLGGPITTAGTQNYSAVTLSTTVTLTATSVSFGATVAGGGNSLIVNGDAEFFGAFNAVKDVSISGATTLHVSSVTTSGAQLYSSGLVLDSHTALSGNTITLGPVTASGDNLTITGTVFLDGSLNGVGNLSISGTTFVGTTDVITSGAQSYSGIVTVLEHAHLAGAQVTFSATVVSGGADLTLTFPTPVTINGASFVGIRHLTLSSGGATHLLGNITTTGTQFFGSPTTLGSDVQLAGTDIILAGSLDANSHGLTIAGNAVLSSAISNLVSLAVTGTTAIQVNSITTILSQTYGGVTTLTSDTSLTGSTIAFAGLIDAPNKNLAIVGNAVLGGNAENLGSLSVSGTTAINAAAIGTAETQLYAGNVTLGANTMLSGSTLSFGAQVIGGGKDLTLAFHTTVTINGSDLTGVRNFAAAPGGATLLVGNLTTSGTQTYQSPVVITASTVLTGSTVTLAETTAVGNASLQIAGNAVLSGPVSGVVDLTITGSTIINAASITTSGDQDFAGPVTVTASCHLTAANVSFASTVTGTNADLKISGPAVLAGNVDGIRQLSLMAGAILHSGAISSTGAQSYAGPVELQADIALSASNVTFTSTVDGAFDLTISAGAATTVLGGVGTIVPLTGLTFNGPGAVTAQGPIFLQSGSLTIAGSSSAAFHGVIGGAANLVCAASGTVLLAANNTYTGTTTVQSGSVTINGIQPSSDILLVGGILKGVGTTGKVTATGGALAPGHAGSGILRTGQLTLNDEVTYTVGIAGLLPGQAKLTAVSGPVDLGGSRLVANISFLPQLSNDLIILRNNGNADITGTFSGLPEGAILKAGQKWFQISYKGGDGNDIILRLYAAPYFATAGSGHVELRQTTDGAAIYTFKPYGSDYLDGIAVAIGDVNGDGYFDVVTGAVVGNPDVRVFDGKTISAGTFDINNPAASLLAQWFPYALEFNVGANVAVGDINRDGFAEVVTGATAGNPDVRVFSGADLASGGFTSEGPPPIAQWFPYALEFNVGAHVAVGDINGDGHADVVTGATAGNPDVRVYHGKDIASASFTPDGASLMAQFFAYELQFNVGAYVAVGDTNGDGYGDVITGSSIGNPEIHIYDGKAMATGTFTNWQPQNNLLTQFFAFDLDNNIGASVATGDFERNGKHCILTGATTKEAAFRVIRGDSTGVKPPALLEGISDIIADGLRVGA
jgi:autotransporter-associated beta strand protein